MTRISGDRHCMHLEIHTYIHTYIHTHTHTHTPTYPSTYLPTYLPTYLHTYIHTNISSESGLYCDIDPYVKPFFPTDPPQMTALCEFLSYYLRVFHVLITLSRMGKINSNASIFLGQAVHTIGLKSES